MSVCLLHDVNKNTCTYKCVYTYTFLTLYTECRVAGMQKKCCRNPQHQMKGWAR